MLLKASKTTLTFLLCFGFAISCGCKSMEFGKPKLPSLPSLAFWKKGEDSEIPPPPARHFDPSRFGGEAETQVAEQTQSLQSEFDQYGMRIKDSARNASDIASKGFKFPQESLEKLNSKPSRKPYGLDDLGGDEVLAGAEQKFNLDSANLKNKFAESKATATDQLSKTQQDFRSAMNSATNLKETAKGKLSLEDNSFAAGDNSFAAAPIAKTIDTAKGFGGIGGGSFSPKSGAFNNVKLASGESAAEINDSLYDAKGRLASATKNAQDFASTSSGSKLKSEFEQRLLAAKKKTESKADAFKAGTLNASDQLNAIAGIPNRSQGSTSKPFPKITADGSLVPQNPKRPVDLNAGQLALQPSTNPSLLISKPNALAPKSFAANPNADDSLAQMRAEIAALKAQVAAVKQSTNAPTEPVQRFAQNTIEGVVLPLDNVNDAFNPRAGSPVANQNSPATPQSQSPNQPSYNSNARGESNSFYPSTPYGGFGSTTSPKSGVGLVGYNSANEFQNQVSNAGGQAPANTYSGPLQASRIDSSASEVLIPSTVLSGNRSFTPGSTSPSR